MFPFLIQLYYEDVLQNDSKSSLRKLEDLANSSKCKMALRYLHKRYSDPDNPHKDSSKAKTYLRWMTKFEEGLFVEKNAIYEIKEFYRKEYYEFEKELDLRKNSNRTSSDLAFLYQNHLLLEVIQYWEFEYRFEKVLFEPPENMYVRMAYLLTQEDNGFEKNHLRAHIFYDLFLEKGLFSDENYKPASILYALNIIEHYLTSNKLNRALEYISKNVSKNEDKSDIDKLMLYALINASLKTLEEKDLVMTEIFLKRALRLY